MMTVQTRIVYSTASQIAHASVASFFWRLTSGLTYTGGRNRTSCPDFPVSRVQ